MPDIYVDIGPMTYNSDDKKAPKQFADKAKEAMKKAAERAVKSASGFTTAKKGEGYTIRFKVTDVAVSPKGVACKVSGELIRYPKALMVSTGITGSGTVTGEAPERAVVDCVDSIVEDLVTKKIVPVMKQQAGKG
jgi:hypothetical protein